jgi:hypothetical protein
VRSSWIKNACLSLLLASALLTNQRAHADAGESIKNAARAVWAALSEDAPRQWGVGVTMVGFPNLLGLTGTYRFNPTVVLATDASFFYIRCDYGVLS